LAREPRAPNVTERTPDGLVEELAHTPTLSAYVSTERARRNGGTHATWQIDGGVGSSKD
jgi:hypothetical protein